MSKPSVKTEKKAISQLVKCLKHFDQLANLQVTPLDAFEARQAENIIRAIIESNGYTISHQPGKGHRLIKSKQS